MTLDNLLATGQLLRQPADKTAIQKLLAAAARNLADAALAGLSADNRFDAAYKTIMQCAMVGLWACGYRTATSKPGHHQTAIQCLPKTMGLPQQTVIVLDALRKQRNMNDYGGDPIADGALDTCLQQSAALLAYTQAWLAEHYPELSE